MTDVTDDLEIEVEAAPEETLNGVEVKPAEDAPAKIIEPEEGLETLKKQLEDEKAQTERERGARIAAEAQARERAQEAVRAQTSEQDSNIQTLTTAIEMVKQSTDGLKARYAELAANGDWVGAGDVQAEMAENAAKKMQLETGLTALKNQPKPQVRNDPIIDPVEALARQLTPQSAAWVRSHPQCATDQRMYKRMLDAHNMATNDYQVDTPGYFQKVEELMGFAARPVVGDTSALSEAAEATQRRAAPASAPVSRAGTPTGQRPNVVRLSQEQREIAYMNWPKLSPKEAEQAYAQEMVKIQRSDGKMN